MRLKVFWILGFRAEACEPGFGISGFTRRLLLQGSGVWPVLAVIHLALQEPSPCCLQDYRPEAVSNRLLESERPTLYGLPP